MSSPALTLNANGQSDDSQAASYQAQVEHDATHQENVQPELGPNNENLEKTYPELVSQLRKLVYAYRQEGIFGRRLEIRRIRQARLFWQELQFGWFDPFSMNWRLPSGNAGIAPNAGDAQEDWGKFMFVTNFYQAFGLSFISLISQDVPSVVFYPEDVDKGEDISAAKAAQTAVELIEFNNQVAELLTLVGYYLWTDGKIGSYTRFVTDGENFGYKDINDLDTETQPFGTDQYTCPECGTETPADQMQMGMMCPTCGRPLDETNMAPAPMVDVPSVTQTRKVPNGREIISIIGGLELNTPVWAYEMKDFPYLQWQREVHRAKLKATFPHVAKRIGQMSGVEGPDDTYARVSRLGVAQGMPTLHPGDSLSSLVTFMQTWIEPWAFTTVEDDQIREQFQQLFPDGCYVAFAGEVYCESRNERMRDHWRVMHALPGDGQSRPSVGNAIVQVQEKYNALDNITMEHYEFGIPPIYVDPQTLDFDALTQQVAEPGAHYPARAKPGQPLAASFFQPNPPVITKDMIEYQQELVGPVAQMLTGLFPAVYGGSMDDVKTASAYAQARDQALGRLGMVWRRLKEFYSQTMQVAVECFRENRTEDAQLPFKKAGGDFDAKRVRLADLQGSTQARPEADETYPRLKSQQKAVLQQFMQIDDPMIQRFFSEPKNQELLISIFGLNDFELPDASSRVKQLKEIDALLQGQPVMVLPFDNHAAEAEECKRWLSSDKGLEAKDANVMGFAAVGQHWMEHMMMAGMPIPGMMPQLPMQPEPEAAAGGGGKGAAPPAEPTAPMTPAPEPSV